VEPAPQLTRQNGSVRDWLVGGALIQRPGELLLVANRRMNGVIDWTPPGGVIDAEDASVLHGLTREVREETGLVVVAWDGPCYEVVVEAPGLGWRMRVEAWRATRVSGDLSIADPDGIVEEARYVAHDECAPLLATVAPWVRDPLHEWIAGPWSERRVYRYSVRGADRATAEVVRLAS
jgi:8-oxo-dGTP diphosphatase